MTDTGGFGTAEAVQAQDAALFGAPGAGGAGTVSSTHLTLPTN